MILAPNFQVEINMMLVCHLNGLIEIACHGECNGTHIDVTCTLMLNSQSTCDEVLSSLLPNEPRRTKSVPIEDDRFEHTCYTGPDSTENEAEGSPPQP